MMTGQISLVKGLSTKIISLKAQDHLECITVAIPLKSTNLWGLCMR